MAASPTRLRVDVSRLRVKCVTHKVGYATKDKALDAAELQMLDGEVQPGCHIVPYLCGHCGEWHLTNRVIVDVGRGGW